MGLLRPATSKCDLCKKIIIQFTICGPNKGTNTAKELSVNAKTLLTTETRRITVEDAGPRNPTVTFNHVPQKTRGKRKEGSDLDRSTPHCIQNTPLLSNYKAFNKIPVVKVTSSDSVLQKAAHNKGQILVYPFHFRNLTHFMLIDTSTGCTVISSRFARDYKLLLFKSEIKTYNLPPATACRCNTPL